MEIKEKIEKIKGECRYHILLGKDLNYYEDNIYIGLIEKIEQTSHLLNSYCQVISDSIGKKVPLIL